MQNSSINKFKLMDISKADMARVEQMLSENTASKVGMIPQVSNRLLSAGGKRLRAMLTLAGAGINSYSGENHIKLAAAVEMMHTATLFHDDVVDEALLRRSSPSANAIAGNAAAVLIGDFLLGKSFRLMVDTGSLSALRCLSDAAAAIAEGEVQQLAAKKNINLPASSYMEIITAKTAKLFSAAAEAGACVAHASDDNREALASFALNLGIAFQIVDDILDYSGDAASTGKRIGSDFYEQKLTLPMIHSIAQSRDNHNAKEMAFWQHTVSDEQNFENDFPRALELIKKYESIEYSTAIATMHCNHAIEALKILPANEWKDGLIEVAKVSLVRAN